MAPRPSYDVLRRDGVHGGRFQRPQKPWYLYMSVYIFTHACMYMYTCVHQIDCKREMDREKSQVEGMKIPPSSSFSNSAFTAGP